jgi:hypothetical protein
VHVCPERNVPPQPEALAGEVPVHRGAGVGEGVGFGVGVGSSPATSWGVVVNNKANNIIFFVVLLLVIFLSD